MSQLDGRRNVFSQAKTKMHRIVDDIISSRKTGTTARSDFLSSLLDDSQINDMSSIRDTLLVLLLAGRESTQNTISWMMYAITQNIQEHESCGMYVIRFFWSLPFGPAIFSCQESAAV